MRLRRTIILATALCMAAMPVAAFADSTPAVVRDGREWHLRNSLSGGPSTNTFVYGTTQDSQPMLCDWNGDGTRTPGVIREVGGSPVWFLRNSNSGGAANYQFRYGVVGDIAVCGDWNGDGRQTPGVVRERANGLYDWYLRNSPSGGPANIAFTYGRDLTPGDLPPTWPIVGDWNGNGVDTPGIVRGHDDGQFQWLLRDSNTGGAAQHDFYYYDGAVWGDHLEVHMPIVGDWSGDGRDGPGVVRSRDGGNYDWLLRNSRTAGNANHVFRYGRHLDMPLEWR
jgi:hypothetical protein